MAVDINPKRAKDFWPAHQRKVIDSLIISQLIVIIVLSAILYFMGVFQENLIAALAAIVGFGITGAFCAIWIYHKTTRPTRDLLAAIVQISGEPTLITPANPNDPRYSKNGFRDALQTLYQLASKQDEPTPVTTDQSSNDILRAALDETSCGFVVMDHKRSIIFSNKSAPTKVNSDGELSLELIFPQDNTLESWLESCEKSSVHAENSWTRIPNGLPDKEGRRFFDVLASYDKGATSEVVVTLIDRTALYNVSEQELDFIAFAAHELRGPITVIRGYLDVLQDELTDVLQDDQQELFHRLTVSANRLSSYINNILNTSRYDRRHLKVHLTESTYHAVYDVIKDDMQLRATAQHRLLSVNIPNDLPTIPADLTSLSEVMGNLIDNAIKYSNEGGAITVSAVKKGDFVEFIVEDHGIGMPSSVVSQLFQKFYRSHRSRETVAGSGIGLYISKAIVESHGGNISVRSEDGQGSTFTITLPVYASVAEKLKAGNNSNEGLIAHGDGWIKNHSMYRG